MSKGNKSKRIGTAGERTLLRKLRALDPAGQWESRNRLPDGTRRPQPPTHGWDIWCAGYGVRIECKVRRTRITPAMCREWDKDISHRPEWNARVWIVYHESGSSQWWIATRLEYNSDVLMHIPLEDFKALLT